MILVSGLHDPVVVDQSVTILGDPSFSIWTGCAKSCDTCPEDENAFRLAGPGGGRVTIGGFTAFSRDCNFPAAAIGGGGFGELHLFDATIQIAAGQTGLGHGASAIDVDIPTMVVSGSTIAGSGSDTDHCSGFLYQDVVYGIHNPGGTILLVDSTVNGGDGGMLCCAPCSCLPFDPTLGGQGGTGVLADAVYLAGSTVEGGAGSTFLAYPWGEPYIPAGTPVACWTQADGTDLVANSVHVLSGNLMGESSASLASSYTLSWDLPGPGAFLFFSGGASSPMATVAGPVVLDLSIFVGLGAIATGSPQAINVSIPAIPALLGSEFVFQAWDGSLGLTRPVVGLITP